MEQKKEEKKRWRPSLGEYRELEEVIHRQCVELDAWRDKYRELKDMMDKEMPSGTYQEVVSRCLAAERSNTLLTEEIERQRHTISNMEYQVREKDGELFKLQNRSFWKRLFNI